MTRTRLKKVRVLMKSGRLEEARATCEKVCAGKGGNVQASSLLGQINFLSGRLAEAVTCYQQVVKQSPNDADAYGKLAHVLLQQGDATQAAESYRAAIALKPDDPKLLTNYAAVLMGLQRPSEAEPVLRTAIRVNSTLSKPYINLGGCLNSQGKTDEAVISLEEGLEHAGPDPVLHSNYLLTRHYLPVADVAENRAAHRYWVACNVAGEREYLPPGTDTPDAERKLRIGYVSPDFRTHSVAYFLRPLLANHDRKIFEIFCYADVMTPDDVTRQFKAMALTWRDVSALDDAGLVRSISRDRIDILVDLAGHTAGNRLMVFARKPAPVQVTWLGYPDTTGLNAIDYRITDHYADPEGFDAGYTETLYRMAGCFLCYEPFPGAPDVAPAPVRENGYITFGSFNNLAKINRDVVMAWASLLKRVAGARLLIKNPGLTDAVTRERYLALFREAGIGNSSITLKGVSNMTREHLAEYNNVDIALDTFPYNGTTTTCEALWMGVPVLSLTGNSHANRVGGSLLTTLGMPGWVVHSPEDYISRAVSHAADPETLVQIRGSLREKMKKSGLCDGSAFAARFEVACRSFWRCWCEQHGGAAAGAAED